MEVRLPGLQQARPSLMVNLFLFHLSKYLINHLEVESYWHSCFNRDLVNYFGGIMLGQAIDQGKEMVLIINLILVPIMQVHPQLLMAKG